ncbi:hypothetical protein Syun_019107 [Stephania yunnanensis]|uniref:Uncharacterized protein n=1 Tax=Stephania yunnanensis TaxID=152371 RepID=A0AAP0IU64_9MAGN
MTRTRRKVSQVSATDFQASTLRDPNEEEPKPFKSKFFISREAKDKYEDISYGVYL